MNVLHFTISIISRVRMSQTDSEFESLGSLLVFVFKQLQTPMLTFDKIIEYLSTTEYTVTLRGTGIVATNSIPKRLILNCLSTSDQFVKSGPGKSQTFALRPNNPFFRCDTAIAATIEQILCANGPMTIEALVASAGLADADATLFERIISQHSEFCEITDARIWFTDAPMPTPGNYHSMTEAVQGALQTSFAPIGAHIDDLRRYLCLSSCQGIPITRMRISGELSQRTDLYVEIERGKYALVGSPAAVSPDPVIRRPRSFSDSPRGGGRKFLYGHIAPTPSEEEFNPDSFFGGSFTFSTE